MKVIGYVRVSTDRQAEEGLGLDVQRGAIQQWASKHHHRLTAIYADEGLSGTNGLESRFALAEALEALRSGPASALVVVRLDRLAPDVILQEQLLREIWNSGSEVYSCSVSEGHYLTRDDPEDPSRKLIRTILGAVAAYERDMISLRLRAGRRRKADRGGFAYGSPPFGFRSEGGELVPEAREQQVAALITQLRREGASLPRICSTLEEAGHQPRRGQRWHPTVVQRIIRRHPDFSPPHRAK